MNDPADRDMHSESTPQEDLPESPKKVLKLARKISESGDFIASLIRNRWYVSDEANLLDLADDFTEYPAIQAVGVVDRNGAAVGIVVRRELFDLLGRPFGRDVLQKESVARVSQNAKTFFYDAGIYAVSTEIGAKLRAADNRYFPLRGPENEFVGLFSSQDLLIHMSELAQKNMIFTLGVQSRVIGALESLENPDFELAAASLPSKGLREEFHRIAASEDGSVFACLADVSGKGISSGLATVALQAGLHGREFIGDLKTQVASLTEIFAEAFDSEKFLNGSFVRARENTMWCSVSNRSLCFLFRKGKLLKIKAQSRASGTETAPDVFRYRLESGDTIVLLSEGMVRQPNNGHEEYGLARIKTILSGDAPTLVGLRDTIVEDFNAFKAGRAVHRDATLVLIRRR